MLPYTPVSLFLKTRKKSLYSICSDLFTMNDNVLEALIFDKLNIVNILCPSKAFYLFSSGRYYQSLTRYTNFIFVQIWTPFDTESPNLQFWTHFDSLDRLYILLPFIWWVKLSCMSFCSKDIDRNVTLYPTFSVVQKRRGGYLRRPISQKLPPCEMSTQAKMTLYMMYFQKMKSDLGSNFWTQKPL